jgi:nitrogen regulatory protein P-II 1
MRFRIPSETEGFEPMIKIDVIVQPFRLDSIKLALDSLGVEGITICHVLDHGGPLGLKVVYRGAEYYVDVPKVKLEMLVSSLRADEVIDALLQAARADGHCDDGTILVTEIADAISMRTGERVQLTIT